jgi:hypothetical protein
MAHSYLVNWYDEGLDAFYGDNNNNLIHGVYTEDDAGEIIDVSWFKTINEQEQYLTKLN